MKTSTGIEKVFSFAQYQKKKSFQWHICLTHLSTNGKGMEWAEEVAKEMRFGSGFTHITTAS